MILRKKKNHNVNLEQVEFEMPARSLAENVQWAVEYMAYILDERCGLDIYVWKSSFIQSFIYKKKKKMFSDCPLRLGPGHQRITVARAMEVDKAAVRMV